MQSKIEILQKCLQHIEKQVQDMETAAKSSASLATDAEHRARSKYETFSLETSYLARGQAMRVAEMRDVLSKLRAFQPKAVMPAAGVEMGALVRVEEPGGEIPLYFLVPAGGGEEVEVEGEMIRLVTLQSPIAQVLLGKKVEEVFTFAKRSFRITEVL
ncbi:hypothetical protein P0Y35_00225 [Kiritimatiellaeota bacterium B1221]|nr:hypothetical protein [Kiritimatiellaeota bacterium B1221]